MPSTKKSYRSADTLDRIVLDLLLECDVPLTAYQLAERSGHGLSALTPAQVYRVLTRLMERGEARRIECLAAYLPASGPETSFLVCTSCRAARPVPLIFERPHHYTADWSDFEPARVIVEVIGLCGRCQANSQA